MSIDTLTNALSTLNLDDPISHFLHAEHRNHPQSPLQELKSVACTISPDPYRIKTRSGWSDCGTSWHGHEILRQSEAVLLARGIAQEIDYTFAADARLDREGKGDEGYWPGRFRACHAEVQLMAWIYHNRHQESMGGERSFEVGIYPRPVCRYCHDFATHVFLATGLQFKFYLNGQRDLPSCKCCGQKIQTGYVCPRLSCSRSQLQPRTKLLTKILIDLAHHLEDFAKALKGFEDEISTTDDESQDLSEIRIAFKSLGQAVTSLSRVLIEFAGTPESVHSMVVRALDL